MEKFNCDGCNSHCEDEFYGSFFTGEEQKLIHFDGAVFQREGVWFLNDCPYYKNKRCTAHDQPFRPLQCIMYPCYLDYGGSIKVDDGCSRSHMIDEKFKEHIRKIVADLAISQEELDRCLRVIGKYSHVADE
jgi:Fe-S-cluster containining protein